MDEYAVVRWNGYEGRIAYLEYQMKTFRQLHPMNLLFTDSETLEVKRDGDQIEVRLPGADVAERWNVEVAQDWFIFLENQPS